VVYARRVTTLFHTLHAAMVRLRENSSIEVVDERERWVIRVPKEGGLVVEVLVPYDNLEWWGEVHGPEGVRIGGGFGFSYDIDGDGNLRGEDAFEEMATDIEQWIGWLHASSLRAVEIGGPFGRRKHVEWRRNDAGWQRLDTATVN
jgi:hypothetical protein